MVEAAAGEPGSAPPPLAGLRVIDCSTVVAGPAAARYLADFGADVIKVERPDGGDTTREMGWRDPDDHTTFWWKLAGRGKRTVALDLKSDDGRAAMLRLCDTAHVVVENFRPGILERLGLGPDVLLARNPRLVLVRITGFGQDGPYAGRPGFATLAEAMSGFAAINGEPDGPPLLPPIALTDEITGMTAAFAALAALRSGRGQVVDLSLWECLYQMMGPLPAAWARLGYLQPRLGAGIPYSVPRGTYCTADDDWVAISTSAGTVAARVMELVGLGDDERFATFEGRAAHRDEVDAAVAAWVGARPTAEVLEVFEEVHAAAAPVMTMEDIAADPHARAREMTVDVDGVAMQNVVARLSATPGRIRWAGRPLGADTDEVLGSLSDVGTSLPDGPLTDDLVRSYLDRLGWEGAVPAPTTDALVDLHFRHNTEVPFENLDIHRGRVPSVEPADLVAKVVDQRRGGICYELNGAFGLLLLALGFRVRWMEARVWDGEGWAIPFDHLCLRVEVPADGSVWLADVGFGDGPMHPVPMVLDQPGGGPGPAHRLVLGSAEGTLELERETHGGWERRYRFSVAPVELGDFVVGCQYHATAEASPFPKQSLASRRTSDGGRITLAGRKWIVTTADGREEHPVPDDEVTGRLAELGIQLEGFEPVG